MDQAIRAEGDEGQRTGAMNQEIEQIAQVLERTGKAMDALGSDPSDQEHVRARLNDFSIVLMSLRERVLALGESQSLTVALPQENQNAEN